MVVLRRHVMKGRLQYEVLSAWADQIGYVLCSGIGDSDLSDSDLSDGGLSNNSWR